MKKELTAQQKEVLKDLYDETEIDMEYQIVNGDLPDTIDDFMDLVQERVGEIEVIYYHDAMEYLKENDPSLRDSLEIADNMGYETKNLNSELLATLLKQQNVGEEIYNHKDAIEEAFYSTN